MTPENAKALLPIITAYAEGKTIQFSLDEQHWYDQNNIDFTSSPKRYRIKLEPKKPTLRWYTWKELCALHVRGNFIIRHEVDKENLMIAKIAYLDGKLVVPILREGSSTFLWKKDINKGWEISFDNINWCPLGVVEQ